MKKYQKFIEEFVSFCNDREISLASARSYISYLNSAVNVISWPKTTLKVKVESDTPETLINDFLYLLVKIDEQKAVAMPSVSVSKKSLSNYKSAIVVFIEYLRDEIDRLEISRKAKCNHVPAGKKIVLYHDDLFRIFRGRIITQGRVYGDYVIPFRTYNKLLRENSNYKKLLNEYIERIIFIVADLDNISLKHQARIPLSKVERIEFRSDFAHVFLSDGSEKKVLTEIFDRKLQGSSFEEFTGSQADLSLDHQRPLFGLRNLIDGKPEMKKLSEAALKYLSANADVRKSELDRNFSHSNTVNNLGINVDVLCDELFDFLSKTELVIMDRHYNSSKNKTVVGE